MIPVLRKDILSLLRLARIAAVFVLFIGLLSTLVLATWPQQGLIALATKGQDDLLLSLVMGQLLVLILTVPGVASVQLTEEKEGNTLEMLYATRLSPISIILGKLGAAICFPVMLLLAGLPFLALLNYRGEVNQVQIVVCYTILITTALMLALLSLAISAICRTSATALVVAYLVVLVVCGAVMVPALIMLDVNEGPAALVLHYARSISPIAAAMSVLKPDINDFGGARHENFATWIIFIPFAWVIILASAAVVAVKLSKPPIEVDKAGGGDSDEARSLGRKLLFLIDDKKQNKPIGRLNPLFAKERRTNQLRSGRWMIRIFYGSAVLGMLLALMSLYGGGEHANVLSYVATVIVSLQFAILALVTPSLASPVISSEIEAGTFEMLRMTRLGGGRIFWGKFIPAFLPSILPVLAMVPAWLVVGFVNAEYYGYAASLAPVTFVALLMCSTIALACSAIFSSSARATVISYMVVAGIFVLPMIAWWTAGAVLATPAAAKVAMISPLAIALDLRPGQDAVPLTRGLTNPHLIAIGSICLVSLIAARLRLRQLMRQG